MQAAKVAGSKAWIKEVKFLFLHSATDDPARAGYIQKLKVHTDELEIALSKLTECEIAIVESATTTTTTGMRGPSISSYGILNQKGVYVHQSDVIFSPTGDFCIYRCLDA